MTNLSNVYDLFHPCPATLKELAVTKVAIELWRQEIINHRTNGTLDKLDFAKNISSSSLSSHAPSVIMPTVDEYNELIRVSIKAWLDYHKSYAFFEPKVLNNFDDFIGDSDGVIHYERTAKRMILCEGLSQVEKFKIACLYCLEDDIVQLWPSVSSEFNLNEIAFSEYPQLFYWICRQRNQLYKIPVPRNLREFINAALLFRILYSGHTHWSCIEYFFNRVDSSKRMCCVKKLMNDAPATFYKYLLAKLNEDELDEIRQMNKSRLWLYMLGNTASKSHITAVWTYLKHKTSEDDFIYLFEQFIARDPGTKFSAILDIWNRAPDNFKQSAIQRVLLGDSVFRDDGRFDGKSAKHISLLLAALPHASFEDRGVFWDKHWCDLMMTMQIGDFRKLMKACFKEESDITRYRETVMSHYEKIGRYCLKFFMAANFAKLEEYLSFLCPGEQLARDIRVRLLGENFGINGKHLKNPKEFDEFVGKAYDDVDRVAEFKNRLLSVPMNIKNFESFVTNGKLNPVKEFIDAVIPSGHPLMDFKKRYLMPIFRQYFTYGKFLSKTDEYLNFSSWCVANDDEIEEFRRTLPIDEIVQEIIRQEMQAKRKGGSTDRTPMTYHPKFVDFFKWQSVTSKAYEEFSAKYAEDDVFVKLITECKKSEKEEQSENSEKIEDEKSDPSEKSEGEKSEPIETNGKKNEQSEKGGQNEPMEID